MPTSVGPNTFGEENLVFGYDTGDTVNSFPGIPAVNCSEVPTSRGSWNVTEITDGSITPPRKGARVFKFTAGSTSNLFRQSGYYGGGGFANNNNVNPLILGRTSPSNFTTVSEANKYRYGFWVRGVESNNAGWELYIDIGDRNSVSYTVGNNTDWYFISTVNTDGTNSNGYPYDFFDIFTGNQGLTFYIADMGIMRSPGTVDSLPILQAYPQWVEYGQERNYTSGLRDLTGNSTIDLTNVSFDSDAQMTFDGSSDKINLGTVLANSIGNQATVEMVFKSSRTNNTGAQILGWGVGSAYYSSVGIGSWFSSQPDESVHIALNAGGSGTNQPRFLGYARGGESKYNDQQYHHLVGKFATNDFQIWVDGQLLSMEFLYGSQSTVLEKVFAFDRSDIEIWVGARPYGGGSMYFAGDLPLLKIYNRALSAAEVQANYNAIKGRFNI